MGETESRPGGPREGDLARLRSLKRDVIARQQQGWQDGSPPSIAQLFELWPGDPETDPDAASLIAEDFLQRKCHGEEPGLDEYRRCYPEHQESCAGLIISRSMMAASIQARPNAQPARRG